MVKKQTMIEIQGGGATRKTGSCCDLDLCHNLKMTCHRSFDEKIECHPELDSGSITDNRLRLGGRNDETVTCVFAMSFRAGCKIR